MANKSRKVVYKTGKAVQHLIKRDHPMGGAVFLNEECQTRTKGKSAKKAESGSIKRESGGKVEKYAQKRVSPKLIYYSALQRNVKG